MRIDTREVRFCAKCKTIEPPLYRHHKGNDGLLSRYHGGIAKRYIQWLDCVDLCFECHLTVHWVYEIKLLSHWVNHTPRGATSIRKRFIELCDNWLEGKIETVPVPDWFRKKFIASRDAFLEKEKKLDVK